MNGSDGTTIAYVIQQPRSSPCLVQIAPHRIDVIVRRRRCMRRGAFHFAPVRIPSPRLDLRYLAFASRLQPETCHSLSISHPAVCNTNRSWIEPWRQIPFQLGVCATSVFFLRTSQRIATNVFSFKKAMDCHQLLFVLGFGGSPSHATCLTLQTRLALAGRLWCPAEPLLRFPFHGLRWLPSWPQQTQGGLQFTQYRKVV